MTPSMTADDRPSEDDGVLPLMSLHEGDVVDAEDAALADRYEVSVGKLWRAYRKLEDELASVMPVVDAARESRRLSVELLSINTNERERYIVAHDAWIKATDATDVMIARLDGIQPVDDAAITAMRGESK